MALSCALYYSHIYLLTYLLTYVVLLFVVFYQSGTSSPPSSSPSACSDPGSVVDIYHEVFDVLLMKLPLSRAVSELSLRIGQIIATDKGASLSVLNFVV